MGVRTVLWEFDPDYVVPTSEILKEWLEYNHLTTSAAAVIAARDGRGSPDHVKATIALNAVLNDGPVGEFEAKMLAKVTSISAGFWLAFEHNYRSGVAAGKIVSR